MARGRGKQGAADHYNRHASQSEKGRYAYPGIQRPLTKNESVDAHAGQIGG